MTSPKASVSPETIRSLFGDPCHKLHLHYYPDEKQEQMRYSDAFDLANKFLGGNVTIIHNADIFVGEGWEKLTIEHLKPKRAFALTRWPHPQCLDSGWGVQCTRHAGSHDAFVFIPPVDMDTSQVAHKQNLPGAENVVHARLHEAGYHMSNPCRDLKVYHYHCSDVRTYRDQERINNGGGFRGPQYSPSTELHAI